ncbi:MAG: type II toxin-antitoxin system RelE/ParE family toxin [Eubacteriales bacterium]|nr:type II toxin-antitoxin system RelE/ParE family toxin [Eubacteriales bacterium]
MNKIHLSEEASKDLLEIRTYIEEDLLNPSAALSTIRKITNDLRLLETFSEIGPSLSSIIDLQSDYRFILSGQYICFYRIYGCNIYVDRILSTRRDYLRVLLDDFNIK